MALYEPLSYMTLPVYGPLSYMVLPVYEPLSYMVLPVYEPLSSMALPVYEPLRYMVLLQGHRYVRRLPTRPVSVYRNTSTPMPRILLA
jgi:hypothetical protein